MALALGACGGTDHGRPVAGEPATPLDAGPDPATDCSAAAGLTLQNITNFEPAPGSNPNLKPTAVCDPAIDIAKSPCMYFNYDTEQSPRLCSSTMPSLPSCVQPDGTPEPASFCMDTNVPSPGQSVVVSPIPGGRCGVSNNKCFISPRRTSPVATILDDSQGRLGRHAADHVQPVTPEFWVFRASLRCELVGRNFVLGASGHGLEWRRSACSGWRPVLGEFQWRRRSFTPPPPCAPGETTTDAGTACLHSVSDFNLHRAV